MADFQLSSFTTDITIPLGHRCMGVLPTKSKEILDPLYAHGYVLLGGDKPIVQVALDWCEVRNEAYDRWRNVLAEAAGTDPERVILSSLHQHDAPVSDIGAENLLARVGLAGELFDMAFHEQCVQQTAEALRESLNSRRKVTHLGLGQAKVEKIASNRRHVLPDGRVTFSRGSASGGRPEYRDAPEGLIDPWLKTLSFWNGDQPLLAVHGYATHPMSYYGRGGVTSDFVGLARDRRWRDDQKVHQIYVSGCSGDVTAGKYNDGSPANRPLLANRLYEAMVKAWDATQRHSLRDVEFRTASLDLDFRRGEEYTLAGLLGQLENEDLRVEDRILAAMGLNSRRRVSTGKTIDFPCVDLGPARIVLFPGEAFVGYQLMAQEMCPDAFVLSIGYGECWTGYIPTAAAFADNFTDKWLWVAPGAEPRIRAALERVLPIA